MGEKPRATLPAVERALAEARSLVAGNPTVDTARERLGGRAQTSPHVGRAVVVTSGLGVEHLGVVVFDDDASVDVWLGAGRVRRLSKKEPIADGKRDDLISDLVAIADSAVVFATLFEGQRVRFQDGAKELHEGLLVEKCRYGALVLTDDEKVIAVGFSSLFPV